LLRRLASAPLVTPLDAPLTSLVTPLHSGGLRLGISGWNGEQRSAKSE
jgi:hypothetical protein